jgi:hypothetical protein
MASNRGGLSESSLAEGLHRLVLGRGRHGIPDGNALLPAVYSLPKTEDLPRGETDPLHATIPRAVPPPPHPHCPLVEMPRYYRSVIASTGAGTTRWAAA